MSAVAETIRRGVCLRRALGHRFMGLSRAISTAELRGMVVMVEAIAEAFEVKVCLLVGDVREVETHMKGQIPGTIRLSVVIESSQTVGIGQEWQGLGFPSERAFNETKGRTDLIIVESAPAQAGMGLGRFTICWYL
jgi:hypothetical protein